MALFGAASTIARSPFFFKQILPSTLVPIQSPPRGLLLPTQSRSYLVSSELKIMSKPHGQRYIDTIDYVLLPILYTIRTIIIINQLLFNLACTLFCTPILLNLFSSSMRTFIALEDYTTRCLILTTIIPRKMKFIE